MRPAVPPPAVRVVEVISGGGGQGGVGEVRSGRAGSGRMGSGREGSGQGRSGAEKRLQKHCWKLLLRLCMMRNLMGNPNLSSKFKKNASQYTLRVANPWGTNIPAGGWPHEELIVITP